MNFASAVFALQRGHKIKRKHWKGYWYFKDGELMIHLRTGEELNLRDSKDMMYTISNMACNDWEIVEDWE